MSDAFRWDDRTWDQVWDHLLGPHERFDIAKQVWRGDIPHRPFEGRVAIELANRWRRRAIVLCVVWTLWSAYWMTWVWAEMTYRPGPGVLLPAGLTGLGVASFVFCLYARRRVRTVATAHDGRHTFEDPVTGQRVPTDLPPEDRPPPADDLFSGDGDGPGGAAPGPEPGGGPAR